jgi:hypothetical protein
MSTVDTRNCGRGASAGAETAPTTRMPKACPSAHQPSRIGSSPTPFRNGVPSVCTLGMPGSIRPHEVPPLTFHEVLGDRLSDGSAKSQTMLVCGALLVRKGDKRGQNVQERKAQTSGKRRTQDLAELCVALRRYWGNVHTAAAKAGPLAPE